MEREHKITGLILLLLLVGFTSAYFLIPIEEEITPLQSVSSECGTPVYNGNTLSKNETAYEFSFKFAKPLGSGGFYAVDRQGTCLLEYADGNYLTGDEVDSLQSNSGICIDSFETDMKCIRRG